MTVGANSARLFTFATSTNLLPSTPVCRSTKNNPDVYFAWARGHGGLNAPPWPSGAARQSPLVSFPSRVSVSLQETVFPSPSDHTSLGFVSLLSFGFSLELSWSHRGLLRRGLRGATTQPPFVQFPTRVPLSPRKITLESPSDRTSRFPFASLPRFASRRRLGSRGFYAPGSSSAATQPPSVSSPPEWLSLLAKALSDLLPTATLDPPSLLFHGLPLGGNWAHVGLITPGYSGAAT